MQTHISLFFQVREPESNDIVVLVSIHTAHISVSNASLMKRIRFKQIAQSFTRGLRKNTQENLNYLILS